MTGHQLGMHVQVIAGVGFPIRLQKSPPALLMDRNSRIEAFLEKEEVIGFGELIEPEVRSAREVPLPVDGDPACHEMGIPPRDQEGQDDGNAHPAPSTTFSPLSPRPLLPSIVAPPLHEIEKGCK